MDSRLEDQGLPSSSRAATPSPTSAAPDDAHLLASSRVDNLGMGSWPARRVRVRPDATAWEFEGRATTYREVGDLAVEMSKVPLIGTGSPTRCTPTPGRPCAPAC